jgi:hypothetical protein
MGLWSFLTGESSSSSYDAGYSAGNEFLDLTEDRYLTDEEANAQWNAVESNHDSDYVRGYADCMEHNSKGFWSRLLGG